MYSSEKNVSSNYETNSIGDYAPHNKKYFLSFINASNMSPNKYKLLNLIDKKDMIYSTNTNLINNFNKKKNSNSILNKLLNNKTKQEKVLFKRNEELSFHSNNMTNENLNNILLEQIKNASKQDNNFNKSYNNNINENINYHTNDNDKMKKINFALESHQLINSLLKNQKKK